MPVKGENCIRGNQPTTRAWFIKVGSGKITNPNGGSAANLTPFLTNPFSSPFSVNLNSDQDANRCILATSTS
jgi:hypothetical protein